MQKTANFVTLLFTLLLLSGCAMLGGGYDPQAWHVHQTRNKALQGWRILAVVNVQAPDVGATFGISWLQKSDVFDVYLIAPGNRKASAHILGKTEDAAVVIFDNQEVDGEETISIKEHYLGNNVDQLVQEKLTMPFPVSGLVYWLRGLENPNARSASLVNIGNKNRLDFLMQDGWDITYASYGEYEGHQLPSRITLASHRFKGLTIDMEIVRWQFRDFDQY